MTTLKDNKLLSKVMVMAFLNFGVLPKASSGEVTENASRLLLSPTVMIVNDQSIHLEAYAWRNLMPQVVDEVHPMTNSSGLMIAAKLLTKDKTQVLLPITHLWVILNQEVWDAGNPSLQISGPIKGPQWPINSLIYVAAEVTRGPHRCQLLTGPIKIKEVA